jgi:hypothetical protein
MILFTGEIGVKFVIVGLGGEDGIEVGVGVGLGVGVGVVFWIDRTVE